MAREKPTRSMRRSARPPTKHNHRGTSGLLLGLLLGIIAAFAALWLYHHWQHPTKPSAELSQRPLSPTPVEPRKPRPTPQPEAANRVAADSETPPFGISEDVFEAGARLYGSRCASCHGTPRHIAAAHPAVLQLWRPNPDVGGTGVSHQRPGQIYRSIANGAPAAGMPAYRGGLTSTQLWQISLLLSNAGQEMPDPVLRLLDTQKR